MIATKPPLECLEKVRKRRQRASCDRGNDERQDRIDAEARVLRIQVREWFRRAARRIERIEASPNIRRDLLKCSARFDVRPKSICENLCLVIRDCRDDPAMAKIKLHRKNRCADEMPH